MPPLFDPASAPGWLGNDATQQGFASQHPTLAQAAPTLVADARDDGSPVLLYKAFLDVLGAFPAYLAQRIGDCVGHGHGHGLDLLQCVEIALGEPSEYRETSTEFIYAASREVAGILRGGDGSYGSAAVQAMTRVGCIPRERINGGGAYSGDRAKLWGRTGPPPELKAAAAAWKLGAAARVATWAELVAAMRNGYPVTVCSSVGFATPRDAQGFCQAKGRWDHCMFVAGVRFDRPGALICQSWGPDEPQGPITPDTPTFAFWADRANVERILSQGDSWALSKAPEFAARPLPPSWSYSSAA